MCLPTTIKEYINGRCLRFFMSVLVSLIAIIISILGMADLIEGLSPCNAHAIFMSIITLWMDPGKLQTTSQINRKKTTKDSTKREMLHESETIV